MCLLIKYGYGSEDEIMVKPLHILLSRLKWFAEDEKRERINRQNSCPFMSNNKKGSNKK